LPGAVCAVTQPPTCGAGQWINGAACTNCVAGEVCPNTRLRFFAEIGTYSLASATAFIECPITSRCTSGSINACAGIQFSSVGGMTCLT
jgi:hypothetical protein